ncbi:TPM domain-containing protein [Blattabacterium cuenoti]|uniref:TPM domain-containing protein n=1 Tax=Blattabacterium cuenoti TaxID=1653831 RepID=UPI00163BA54E|nr:TPM domain-containing protein [Blattabacterium cuenoti]
MNKTIQFIILIFSCINLVKGQLNIPEIPKKISPIQDNVGVLSRKQIKKLNEQLILYSKITSTEILVSIINNLHGEDPNVIAYKWGEKWKIGNFHKNNGIVILLSVNDRKISIQNGYGIEPYLTDFLTTKIIRKIKPILKNGLYYKAIDYSIQEIFKILKDKYKKNHTKKVFPKWNLLIYISVFFLLLLFIYKTRDYPLLLNTLLFMDFLNKFHNHEHEENFNEDEFGGGGHFGGGGSSGNW